MRCLMFLFSIIMLAGCSTLKMHSDDVINLEACKDSSCETSFLIHSSKEEWLEQVIFESETPLVDTGVLKNTCVDGHVPLGVGYSSENPLLVLVPIGQQLGKGLKVSIIHSAPTVIKLRLKYPLGISINPTR